MVVALRLLLLLLLLLLAVLAVLLQCEKKSDMQ